MKITTNRLLLRPVSQNDQEAIFAYRSDKDTNKYQGWIPQTLADVEDFIENLEKKSIYQRPGFNL